MPQQAAQCLLVPDSIRYAMRAKRCRTRGGYWHLPGQTLDRAVYRQRRENEQMYDSRDELAKVFEDTQRFYTENRELAKVTEDSRKRTVYYGPDEMPEITMTPNRAGHITVTRHKTFEAAIGVHAKRPNDRIAVLNFASAVNPGGGVVNGSRAQEESLCRCSNLYPMLNQRMCWDKYYGKNRVEHNPLYSDAVIYSPDVRIIKTDDGFYQRLPESKFVKVDVITCAAPNLGSGRYGAASPLVHAKEQQTELHISRAKHILSAAAAHDINTLILGAFGCGAFHNDPHAVASAYRTVMEQYRGYFDEIEFAIFCTNTETENYRAFQAAFN